MFLLLLLRLIGYLRYSLLNYSLEGKKSAKIGQVLSNNKAVKSKEKRKYTCYSIKGYYKTIYLSLDN